MNQKQTDMYFEDPEYFGLKDSPLNSWRACVRDARRLFRMFSTVSSVQAWKTWPQLRQTMARNCPADRVVNGTPRITGNEREPLA